MGINTFCGVGGFDVPVGGTKRSGIGRELGPTSMEAFSNLRTYLLA